MWWRAGYDGELLRAGCDGELGVIWRAILRGGCDRELGVMESY